AFRFGRPVPAEQLGAYLLPAAQTPVIAIRWSLRREPVRAPLRPSTAAKRELRERAAAEFARLDPVALGARRVWGARRPSRVHPGDRPYGPAGAFVRALASQVATADVDALL